ncbi:MAG: bifunctional chorismate mutase/prephenate dehydratase, partial [Oscillibacter sp.]|nr:bifunctional chorismate mutase/prephenate dehydratase [Oscillibacter sp.]
QELAQTFLRRLDLSAKIGAYKRDAGLPALDQRRELQVIQNASQLTQDEERKLEMARFFENILALSRREQRMNTVGGVPGEGYVRWKEAMKRLQEPIAEPKVVYQGEPGAYSEMACLNFFGPGCNCQGLKSFDEVFQAVAEGRADYGMLPIENSSTGGIRQVYELLGEYDHHVVGETTVKVEHCLMAPPGASVDTITHVYSHEQGLFQSDRFLKQYPHWIQVPFGDTAGSGKHVAECGDITKAAICSSRAAELYGLNILVRGTNHNSNNTTRFVVVSPKMELREGANKISAVLSLPHEVGSLHEVLTLFAIHNLNMTKLESRPMPGHSWEYLFFVEFTGSLADPEVDAALLELSQVCSQLRILGNFESHL